MAVWVSAVSTACVFVVVDSYIPLQEEFAGPLIITCRPTPFDPQCDFAPELFDDPKTPQDEDKPDEVQTTYLHQVFVSSFLIYDFVAS